MTELKTLKDIEMNENLNIVYSEDLRAEAIKWIKLEGKGKDREANYDINNWIEHFFNLSDADLQEKK